MSATDRRCPSEQRRLLLLVVTVGDGDLGGVARRRGQDAQGALGPSAIAAFDQYRPYSPTSSVSTSRTDGHGIGSGSSAGRNW